MIQQGSKDLAIHDQVIMIITLVHSHSGIQSVNLISKTVLLDGLSYRVRKRVIKMVTLGTSAKLVIASRVATKQSLSI
jgi:hypothetical protein